MMMVRAQGDEILEVGRPLVGPVHNVMDVGEDVVRAAGESTPPISPLGLPALRPGGEATGAPFEHGVTERVVEAQGNAGIAADAADGLRAQEAQALDLG